MFYCETDDCKDKGQKLFCMDCVVIDFKHNHSRVLIQAGLSDLNSKWTSCTENYKKIEAMLDQKYPLIEPIINYLDNENVLRQNLQV